MSDLRSAAYSQLDALGKHTAAQLALALEDEELVDISVCIESPNIIIPESFEDVRGFVLFCFDVISKRHPLFYFSFLRLLY